MLQPHQERVVAEKAELDDKIAKLEAFLRTDTYLKLDTDERIRLKDQHRFMIGYSNALARRIAAF